MSRTIQFMCLVEILPAVLPLLDGKIGIQIAVLILRLRNQINDGIHRSLQLFVRKNAERISRRLNPLGCITVLKYPAVKAVARILSAKGMPGIDEILNNMAFFRVLRLIAENRILIRDDDILDQALVMTNEASRRFICFLVDLV